MESWTKARVTLFNFEPQPCWFLQSRPYRGLSMSKFEPLKEAVNHWKPEIEFVICGNAGDPCE